MAEIWLTRADKADSDLQADLKNMIESYKKKKYLVAVYESGDCDLYRTTLELLKWNKCRFAQLEVQREKTQHGAEPK